VRPVASCCRERPRGGLGPRHQVPRRRSRSWTTARIHKYASCDPECFVLALVYIDRLIQRNSLLLTSLNVHRIIITAIMLAAKFFDDQYFNNAYYAKVGGVPTSEVSGGRHDDQLRRRTPPPPPPRVPIVSRRP